MSKVADYYDNIADRYAQQYDPANLFTSKTYPANYFRLQIMKHRLAEIRAKTVYEIGVGDGTALLEIAKLGLKVTGCDISPKMVERAKANFEAVGMNPADVYQADILGVPHLAEYDSVIANGVLPHVNNDEALIKAAHNLIRPGGTAFIEFRNKLFSLFTFNRHTKDFILNDLLVNVSPLLKATVAVELEKRLNNWQPHAREFDDIAKFHNPYELLPLFEKCGFRIVDTHWYHFHPTPPMMEESCGQSFRRAAVDMELKMANDWRGAFLCSAGLIEAVKL